MATTRSQYALVFLALFVPYSYFNHSDGWNQNLRLAELHAVVIQHTLTIDAYHHRTGDKALINGHYYSEKAPLGAVIALPSFAATVMVERWFGVDPDSPLGWRISEWTATAASAGLIAALGGVAFFALLLRRFDRFTAVVGTALLFLGSLTWPYATSLFSHGATVGLLAIALWASLGRSLPNRDYIAGLAAGCSVASEYPGVIPCAVIGLYLGSTSLPRMWRFGAGTIPAALLILVNNYAKTGSLFSLGYGANANFPEISSGNAMGFGLPHVGVMAGMMWGEYRGLFFWCIGLLMAAPGLIEMFRKERAIAVMVTSTFLLVLLQVGAFFSAFGGNAIGPRYMSPAIPFVGLAAAYGIKRWPEPGLVLTLISMIVMLGVTAIAIDPPGDVMMPLRSFYLVRLRDHRFSENLGTLLGAPVWISLIVPLLIPAIAAWRWLTEPHAVA